MTLATWELLWLWVLGAGDQVGSGESTWIHNSSTTIITHRCYLELMSYVDGVDEMVSPHPTGLVN